MRKITIEEARQEFIGRGYTPLFDKYKNNKSKLLVKSAEGYKLEMTINHLKDGVKSNAFNPSNQHTIDNIKLWIELHDKSIELVSTRYVTARSKLVFKCKKHGEFRITWNDLQSGYGCKLCGVDSVSGENCYRYNHDLSELDRERGRSLEMYPQFVKSVYKRDGYACVCCGDNRGGNLNAHHLNGYNWCKNGRTDVGNGITLCKSCHGAFHKLYGQGNNTKEQWTEFISKYQVKAS